MSRSVIAAAAEPPAPSQVRAPRLRLVGATCRPAGEPDAPDFALVGVALTQLQAGDEHAASITWQRFEDEARTKGNDLGLAVARWGLHQLPQARRELQQADGRGPRADVDDPLVVTTLGGFSVHRASRPAAPCVWTRPLVGRVVRFLLVHRAATVSEDDLFEALWPGKAPSAARRSLAVALSLARKELDGPAASESLIRSEGRRHQLVLRPGDRVDAEDFGEAANRALRSDGRPALAALETAATLWMGEPLPEDRYADWAQRFRQDLVERFGGILAALTDAYAAADRHDDALRTARRRVALDPLDERAQRALIAAYARVGRRGMALAQYLDCRQTLADALGIEPCASTRDLQQRILSGMPV